MDRSSSRNYYVIFFHVLRVLSMHRIRMHLFLAHKEKCVLPAALNSQWKHYWFSLMRVSYLINSTLNRTQKRSERKRPQPCAECYETLALNDQMLSVEYCSHFTKNAIEIDYFTRIVNYYQFYGLKFCLLICLFVNLIYDLDQDDACIVNICYFNYRIVVITLF